MAELRGATNGLPPNGSSSRHKTEERAARKQGPSTSSSFVLFIGLFVTSVTVAFGLGCIAQIFVARRLGRTAAQWSVFGSFSTMLKVSHNASTTSSLDGKYRQCKNLSDTLSLEFAASQHLLMDVQNVDEKMLWSEPQLLGLVERSASQSSLKKLSSFCHSKSAMTTCVIALEEGSVVIRAWPHRETLLLDIFLREAQESMDAFSQLLERTFSPVKENKKDGSIMGGAMSHVAIRSGRSAVHDENEAGTESCGRTLDKYLEPGLCKGTISIVEDDGSWLGRHGGIILSSTVASKLAPSRGEAYHEALVHPGMLVHRNPSRVAVLDVNDRSIIREILKHRTVRVLKVLSSRQKGGTTEGSPNEDTDAEDCSASPSLRGDDDRVAISYRTSTGENISAGLLTEEDPFDVVIANALEQWDNCEHVAMAYAGLSDDGVLIMPFGSSPFDSDDANGEMEGDRSYFMDCIEGSGFGSAHIYEEAHGSLARPHLFLVACKDIDCRQEWYANEAENNWEIHKRIMRTDSGLIDLQHLDGATMGGYQRPPKSVETMFCRRNPDTLECKNMRGYDPLIPNVYVDKFEVKNSTTGEYSGRGLFTTVDIAKGSYIFHDIEVHTVQFYPLTNELVQDTLARYPEAHELKALYSYMEGYGYESDILGGIGSFVDSSIATFMNHGCNGTFNYGSLARNCLTGGFASEYIADPNNMPQCEGEATSFNPVVDRRLEHQWSSFDGALKDIAQGEELFTNYLLFTSKKEDWYDTVIELQGLCSGKMIGLVAQIDQSGHDTEWQMGMASAQ